MPEMISIGKIAYTKIALEREIRWLLHESPMGVELPDEGFRFMQDVLRLHPRAEGKIGCGLKAIRVIASKWGNRCFEVVRADGSTEPFSIGTCLTKKKAKAQEEPPPHHEDQNFEGMFKD